MRRINPCALQRRILIGVGGGISAYKVCEVVSTLAKLGAEVRIVVTDSAQQFITPLTLATLSRHRAYSDRDFWEPTHGRPLHIQLGEWAELFVIAPLTANTLAKLAAGMADNLLTNTVLASTCPLLLVPAMNREMWKQRAVQRNWQQVLSDRRVHSITPVAGVLACDLPEVADPQEMSAFGAGRMAEPEQIVAHINSLLHTNGKRDLATKQVLVSAGGTREHFDPVRFIGNPATGKMGIAIARAAVHRGAQVTLVHGPMDVEALSSLPEVKLVGVTDAGQMYEALSEAFPTADITIMAAAVADVRPATFHPEKLPKRSLPEQLKLEPVTDIISELAQRKRANQQLIGFAAQTGDILHPAEEKLRRKNLDAIVANPIDKPDAGFGSDTNQAILLDSTGRKLDIVGCSKLQLAHYLLDFIQDSPERGWA